MPVTTINLTPDAKKIVQELGLNLSEFINRSLFDLKFKKRQRTKEEIMLEIKELTQKLENCYIQLAELEVKEELAQKELELKLKKQQELEKQKQKQEHTRQLLNKIAKRIMQENPTENQLNKIFDEELKSLSEKDRKAIIEKIQNSPILQAYVKK